MKLMKFNGRKRTRINDEEARRLTELFLDGSTSLGDERSLYDYYRGHRIASDLEQYRRMFAWYESLGNESQQQQSRSKFKFPIAAAAAIAVLVFAGVGLLVGHNDSGSNFGVERMYAGSYIIRDGKKISDINEILPELQKADHFVDSTMTAINARRQENYEKIVLEHALAGVNDPQVKEMLLAELL